MDSLLDFDPVSTNTTKTTNGHINDPFDFDPFGPSVETERKTSSLVTTIKISNNAEPIVFDPFSGFGQNANNVPQANSKSYDTEFELLGDFTNSNTDDAKLSWNTDHKEKEESWTNPADNSYVSQDHEEANDNDHYHSESESKISHFDEDNHSADFQRYSNNDFDQVEDQPRAEESNYTHSNEHDYQQEEEEEHSHAYHQEEEVPSRVYQHEEAETSNVHHYEEEEHSPVHSYSADHHQVSTSNQFNQQRYYEDDDSYLSSSRSSQARKEKQQADKVSSLIFDYGATADNVCKQCNKRVYEMEKVTVDNTVYHKMCFRCATCNRALILGNYTAVDGHFYCKADFMKNFKLQGDYSRSFATALEMKARGEDFVADGRADYEAERASNQDWQQRMANDDQYEYDNPDNDIRASPVKEEIPTIELKSVKNIFEKLSQGTSQPAGQQPKSQKNEAKQQAFKWQVKEAVPLNRGSLIVHGDVPKKSNAVVEVCNRPGSEDLEQWNQQNQDECKRRDYNDDQDIVHGDYVTVINEEELPPPATTRTLLERFKCMEDPTKAPPIPKNKTSFSGTTKQGNNFPPTKPNTVRAADEDDDGGRRTGSIASPESGEYENYAAERDPGVIRESDNADDVELPASGTTRSLLAKFKSLQTK